MNLLVPPLDSKRGFFLGWKNLLKYSSMLVFPIKSIEEMNYSGILLLEFIDGFAWLNFIRIYVALIPFRNCLPFKLELRMLIS